MSKNTVKNKIKAGNVKRNWKAEYLLSKMYGVTFNIYFLGFDMYHTVQMFLWHEWEKNKKLNSLLFRILLVYGTERKIHDKTIKVNCLKNIMAFLVRWKNELFW